MNPTPIDELIHSLRLPVDHQHWADRLRSDPLFAVEMRVCREWGLSHSQFLAWDPDDREKAIAYVIHEGQRCGSCGIHPDDWPTEDAEPYEVEGRRCFGCQATERYLSGIRDHAQRTNDQRATWGLQTVLKPKPE